GRRAATALGLAIALLVAACSGNDDRDGGSPAEALVDPSGLTAEQLGRVRSCRELHDAVLTWLDRAAARAKDLQGDGDALDAMVESMMSADGPLPGLEPVEGLFPAAPYGGIAGPAAVERYEEL